MNDTTIVKAPVPGDFTMVPNGIGRSGLSNRAVGLLVRILMKPDNWRISAARFAAEVPESKGQIEADIKELERHGYAVRSRSQNPDTGHWGTVLYFFNQPQHAVQEKTVKTEPVVSTEEPRYKDRATAVAARIVSEAWIPYAGSIAQPDIAVIKAVAVAVGKGTPEGDLAAALTTLAKAGQTVTATSLTRVLTGKPVDGQVRGQLKADASTYKNTPPPAADDNGNTPF